MYCDNCGSEIDDGARFCEYCGSAVTGPSPSAGRVAPVHSGDTPDAIEDSRKARTWTWVACGAGLVVVLFSVGLIVLRLGATSRDLTPSEAIFAPVSVGGDHACGVRTDGSLECWGDDFPAEVVDTRPPAPENAESDMSRRSFEASKPSIPTSSLPLANSDLYSAVWRGRIEQVRTLVNAGADVNARDSDGDTLLHEASWRGHTEIVQILVEAGAEG